jgi:hypothetical protein
VSPRQQANDKRLPHRFEDGKAAAFFVQSLGLSDVRPSTKWCDVTVKVGLQGGIVRLLVGLKRG